MEERKDGTMCVIVQEEVRKEKGTLRIIVWLEAAGEAGGGWATFPHQLQQHWGSALAGFLKLG
jgi:hypothetical protein